MRRGRVPVQVVPGITSAVAAPAAAGIPVTHRGIARSFAVVTGSTAHAEDTVDLARMATATDTLVVLMAAGKLAETCATLVRAGRDPTSRPRSSNGHGPTISGLRPARCAPWPTLAADASIGPPATLIVGEVVALPAEARGSARWTRRCEAPGNLNPMAPSAAPAER